MSPSRYRLIFLAMLGLTLLPMGARAACSVSGGKELVNMAITSPITIDPNLAVGSVIATSSVSVPSPSNSQITCTGTTTSGVFNLVGAQSSGASSTIYATGVAGVGYQVLHPDTSKYLLPYGFDSIAAGTYSLSVGSAIQLVKTGPIASGATLNAGTLGFWQFAGSGSSLVRAEDFVLSNAVTFVYPTCTVNTTNIAVTLPTVSNTSLSSVGAVAGATAFTIGMTCPSGAANRNLAMQFDTANPQAGTTGVIAPSTASGRAKNVGVQLVDKSFTPVTFGTPALAGTTPTGAYNLTYYARYYVTATPVAAGSVNATATFTVSYP